MKVLLTGGTGYIGSHTCVCLLQKGYETVIIDNLSNSSEKCLDRIEKITGVRPRFYIADCRDARAMDKIFAAERPSAVIHFAGMKAVGESVEKPLLYYENNVGGTINVLNAMKKQGGGTIIFSSSATVYKLCEKMPLSEENETYPYNPYGWTKFMSERIIEDECAANPNLNAVNLRYFNPVGAHESGLIGENPRGIPNNLMPYITQVALKKRDHLNVFGNDYPTIDGTGVRDYLHVCDLAEGHAAALDYAKVHGGCSFFNLGTGRGTSVLEILSAFKNATGIDIPYQFTDRRAGDLALYYADPTRAENVLGWRAKRCVEDMCADAWHWQSMNPNGYEG